MRGEFLYTARVVNTMAEQLNSFASEVTSVDREFGTEGKPGGQAMVRAVATGDLATRITVDAHGEIPELKNTINVMADQLSSCAADVTRVAQEADADGREARLKQKEWRMSGRT